MVTSNSIPFIHENYVIKYFTTLIGSIIYYYKKYREIYKAVCDLLSRYRYIFQFIS